MFDYEEMCQENDVNVLKENLEILITLINSYDKYIQEANEEDYYLDGWKPVCISEYFNNEFQEEIEW